MREKNISGEQIIADKRKSFYANFQAEANINLLPLSKYKNLQKGAKKLCQQMFQF